MVKPNVHVMVVEPDSSSRELVNSWLSQEGYNVTALESGESALKLVHERLWDFVILSVSLRGMTGMEVLERIKKQQPGIPVMIMVEMSQLKETTEAMKLGASSYVIKPLEQIQLLVAARRIIENREVASENEMLRNRLDNILGSYSFVGRSPAITELREKVKTIAADDGPVMIYGEHGVGKEYLAKMFHGMSKRRYMPFEAASLSFVPPALIESELFGHEKAAFTGAAFTKNGRFELANFGTIYLDEVSELSPELQIKIEQMLDKKEFRRVDGTQAIKVDVRIISGSISNLEEHVKKGAFREELYRRLTSNVIYIPSLKERPEDIPLLADHFLQVFSARINKRIKRISQSALDFITDYAWPGNVRELQNAIERAVILARNDRVDADDLPFRIRGYLDMPRTKSIKEWEKHHIRHVLDENAWNISKSAKDLGIDRVTLYNKIKRYKLKKLGTMGEVIEPEE